MKKCNGNDHVHFPVRILLDPTSVSCVAKLNGHELGKKVAKDVSLLERHKLTRCFSETKKSKK